MKLLRAHTAGFCMGVGLALRKLDQALGEQHSGSRLLMLGPIIHNPQVMDFYTKKGVICANTLDEVHRGDTVIIRAHGIPRESEALLRTLGAQVLDATCPRVKRAQLAIDKATGTGLSLYLFGEREHPEVRGLVSYANAGCSVIGSLNELGRTQAFREMEQVVLAAQTTQERAEFEAIRTCLERYHTVTVLDTICDATRKRQQEAQNLAQQVEAMVVVGGRSSGNTRRLADVAGSCGIPVWHIEIPEELPVEEIRHFHTVGLTAGASTPKNIIDAVERALLG